MLNIYKIKLTESSASAGPFTIYHTSETPANILFSNMSRSELAAGTYLGIDSSYSIIVIKDTGECNNSFTVTL